MISGYTLPSVNGLATIDWVIILAYLLFAVAVGCWAARRAGRSTDSYFIAGRSLPWWVAGTSMVATTFAADTPLWVAGIVASRGIAGNWFWWTLAIPHVLLAVYFARLWRRSRVVTDAGVTEVRYSGRSAAVLRGVKAFYFAVPINCIVMGWVILAMQKILGVFICWESILPDGWYTAVEAAWPGWVGQLDPNTGLSLAVCILLAVTYSVLGGIRGVVVTDLIQFVMSMAGALALAWLAVGAAGGLGDLRSNLDLATGDASSLLAWIPPAGSTWMPLHLFAMYLLVMWWAQRNSEGGGYFVQRLAACRDAGHAAKATLWFTFCHYVLRTWPWILVALAALVLYPPGEYAGMDREAAYPLLMRDLLPAGLLGIAVAALVAAFMSTIDTHVNWGASYLVTDVYKRFIRPDASERHHVLASRLAVVLMAVGAAFISTQMDSIHAAWKLFIALGAGLGLPHLARWLWWRANAWTELSALIATTAIALIAFLILPKTSSYAALSAPTQETLRVLLIVTGSTVVWLPVTLLTRPVDPDVLDAFYRQVRPLGWWGPVRARCDGLRPAEKGRTVLTAWAAGLCFVFCLLFGLGEMLIGSRLVGGVLVVAGAAAGWWTYRLMMQGEKEDSAARASGDEEEMAGASERQEATGGSTRVIHRVASRGRGGGDSSDAHGS